MKIAFHIAIIAIICTISVVLMLFPFFPGAFDSFSIVISSLLRVCAFMALPLTVLGIIWLLYALKAKTNHKRSPVFAIIALFLGSLVTAAACLIAFGGAYSYRGSLLLALFILFFYLYIVIRKILPGIKCMKSQTSTKVTPIVFYMIIIPVVLVGTRLLFLAPLVEFSRDTAIKNSAVLIADIEKYHAEHGVYPISLQGVWKDYETGVVGIEKYYYERNGDAFNIFFEHIATDLATREIVMFNKNDEQNIRSHPSFIFRLTEKQWNDYRGYYAENPLPFEHWKYYSFD